MYSDRILLFVLVWALREPNFPSPSPSPSLSVRLPALQCLWVASCLEKITLKNCTELKLELRVTLWKINIGSETGREGGKKGRGRGAHQNFSFIFPSFLLSPSGDSVTFL